MKRVAVLFGVVLLSQFISFAQSPAPEGRRPRAITVRGTGIVSLAPDQVRLSVQINVRGESASSAMTTASQRTKEILNILDSYGVNPKDIQTSRVGVSPIYDYEKRTQPPPIVGYTATNEFSVVFKQELMKRVGEFLDKAVAAGAANFGTLQYESSTRKEHEREALVKAAADAKARAQALAGELGVSVGRVISVSEVGVAQPGPIVQTYARSDAALEAPVMTGQIDIEASVDAVFEVMEKMEK